MSPYLAGGILVAFLAWSGAMYYAGRENESHICTAADNAHDLAESQNTVAAEKKVTAVVETQGSISREASKDYAKSVSDIGTAYSSGVQSTPAGPINSLPATSKTAGGTCSNHSKVYKMTPQQCDQEEAKCNALWNWANQQAAVK